MELNMDLYTNLLANISKYVVLTAEETDRLISIIKIREIKRRELIDEPVIR